MCHKIFEAWKTFFSNSYLGVLRLFLRVLEVARSRRLGIAGEVSVWQIPENSVPVSTRTQDFFAQDFGRGVFLMGKTINDRVSNKELRPSGICLGATWAGIFCYTEIADLWRLDFIYTGFADAWRLDFIYTEFADAWGVFFLYTEIADTNWSLGDSRGDDIAFVSSQMQAKFRRRFRVVFS